MSHVSDRVGSTLAGRYQIQRELGRGGMGVVYSALDTANRRIVAVKLLEFDAAMAIGRTRFLREIEIATRLSHPYILPLYDSGEYEGALFYVMPFVEAGSLRQRLDRERQLPISEALRLAGEVGEALAYAHANGIVHRDVKPANIMIGSDHALLADFGVALVGREVPPERLTASGISIGTPTYMSPEQASGERNLDGRSDVYSLGCVLYEMLSGDVPFNGQRAEAIQARKMFEPVPSLRVVRRTVTDSLERATFHALERSAADRPAAVEFVNTLQFLATDHAHSGPSLSAPPTITDQNRSTAPGTRPTPSRSRLILSESPETTALVRTQTRWYQLLWFGVAALLGLTAIGLLTTVAYDFTMKVPDAYRPSRIAFPILGLQALVPVVTYAILLLIGFLLVKLVFRFILWILRRSPLGPPLHSWQQRAATTWSAQSRAASPEVVAELFLLAGIVASGLVIARYGRFLPALWGNDQELLSCVYRESHRDYTLAMVILMAAIFVGRHFVTAFLSQRQAGSTSIRLANWGGLALIFLLVMIQTVPWRVLWKNDLPMATLHGEPVFVLMQRGTDIVLYHGTQHVTLQYRTDQDSGLTRLNKAGYVFGTAGCQ